MKKQWFPMMTTVAIATTALLVLFWLMGDTGSGIPTPALAAPRSLTVTDVDPTAASNDIGTPIVIQGTGFTAALSGTVVITAPIVYLDDDPLPDVIWGNTTTLSATVPWGMEPGVYTLTVVNPGEGAGSQPNAFTVTQGLGVFTTDGPYGGDVVGIEKKPGTPTTVYALASGVGLFVSEDAGGWWELIYSVDWMTDLAFDAQDPDVMYLGTWRSRQFARSLNGGQTWETIPQVGFPASGNRSHPATHPTDAGKVFMGVGDPGGELLPGEGGVFRSDDYGMTWITKTNGMTDTDVQPIAIHPNDPDKMLAGTWDGNLYVSTDGGENWSLNAHLDGHVGGVYFNPYQPLEAWASAPTPNHDSCLYKSSDLTTWTPVIVDASLTRGERWNLTFLTDTIWASGSVAYTSTNGGVSWTEVPNLYHGANVVAVTPENPQEIYVGYYEGVDKSEDGGQTWQQINEGLAGIVPRAIAVPRTEADSVYVKTGQGLFRSFNGGHAWQYLEHGGGGGWGDWLVVDAYTPTRVYLGGDIQCVDAFCIEISADAGETWHIVTATLPVTYAGWESAAYALAPHPQIPGRILAGNWMWRSDSAPWMEDTLAVVYASDDYGQSWTYLGPTQPVSPIMDIAYDAVNPSLVYMATAGSGQWKSTDGGTTWRALPFTRAGEIADEIAPHPTISGHLILSTSDHNNGVGLYSSQDAGETWTFLTDRVSSPLVYAPALPPILYGNGAVPQNFGLVRSTDNGQTWELIEGAPIPTSLATATDGERVILYIGSAGSLASQADMQQTVMLSNAALEQSSILGGGVYRMTTRLPNHWVYLPLMLRGHAP